MNKKGSDKIVSVYWFAILFIIAAAVVYMVLIFYGKPYDVREIESSLLAKLVADCVSNAGKINENVLDGSGIILTNENFMETCHLNFGVEDSFDWSLNSEYFVNVEFSMFEGEFLKNGTAGNSNLLDFCKEEFKSANNPSCLEDSFYSLDSEGNAYKIKITSLVRKTEKNVG